MENSEQQNRLRKVIQLWILMEELNITADEASKMDDERWMYLAHLAEVTKPSIQTRELVVLALKTREHWKARENGQQ